MMKNEYETTQRTGRILSRVGALFLAGAMLMGTCACKEELSMEDWDSMGEETVQSTFKPFTDFTFAEDCVSASYREHQTEKVMEIVDIVQEAVHKGEFVVDFGEDINEMNLGQAWLELMYMNPKCSELQFKHLEDGKYELYFIDMNSEFYDGTMYYLVGGEDLDGDGELDNISDTGEALAGYLSHEEVLAMQQELTDHVETVIRENVGSDYGDEEKARAIYEYMVENFEVDIKAIGEEIPDEYVTLRDLIVKEYGPPEFFPMIYRFYLAQLGMDAVMVSDYLADLKFEGEEDFYADYLDDEMHMWNCVYIRGQWYMMDVCYEIAEYRHRLETTGEDKAGDKYFGMSAATRQKTRYGGYLSVFGPMSLTNKMKVPDCAADLGESAAEAEE